MILDILEVLIMPNGGAKLKGELFINDVVHCIGKQAVPVKDGKLLKGEWRTIIVHWNGLQDTIVNGVPLAISGKYLCFLGLDGIRNKRGNDKAVGDWIRDEYDEPM